MSTIVLSVLLSLTLYPKKEFLEELTKWVPLFWVPFFYLLYPPIKSVGPIVLSALFLLILSTKREFLEELAVSVPFFCVLSF